MKEIRFRAKIMDSDEWCIGVPVPTHFGCGYMLDTRITPEFYDSRLSFEKGSVFPIKEDTIGQYTGLKDSKGVDIYVGDILKFDDSNGIWMSSVVFTRGLFGLDVCKRKQIKNPEKWDKTYDRVESRHWGIEWGYEETGTAFTYRAPLAKSTLYNEEPCDYESSEYKKWHEKFGWGEYRVDAEIIGNIYDNQELLKSEEIK